VRLAWSGVVAPGAIGLLACAPAATESPAARQVTFNRDVAPILFEHCSPCHRPGESAPFSLLAYRDARSRARQIAEVTLRRYMPPWPPEPGYVSVGLLGERRLTDGQIDRIQAWVSDGAVEGDPADLPAAPRYTSGWALGPPDLVLEMGEEFVLPAEGSDVFRNFVIPSGVDEVRWVRAVDLRPGNKKIVHHANLLVDRTKASRRLDAAEPGPGFGGMELLIETDSFEPHSHFLFWKPGTPPLEGSERMAWRLDRNTDLVLNMHLQPSGKPEPLRAEVAIYFADGPPSVQPMLLQLEADSALDIPPHSHDFEVSDSFELPLEVAVLGVYPHAHYLGKRVHAWATLPDGTRKWLIRIDDWDFDWQAVYRYREPILLPKGTVLQMRFAYDNSADNPRNPAVPPRRVVAGNRSQDEMAHLWVQVLPTGTSETDPRLSLQGALMRRWLEKHPGDYVAHFNLGSVLAQSGSLTEAERHLREAIRARPGDATALTGLGAVLHEAGRAEEAVACYRDVLARRPDHAHARYNLGTGLMALGRNAEALSHFRRLLEQEPQDVDALNNVGYLLAESGDLPGAIAHYERSVRLAPADADAWSTLGYLLASRGQLDAAAARYRRALALDPAHEEARRGLEAVRLSLEGGGS
jgi:Flp pilus assembly protein TadD